MAERRLRRIALDAEGTELQRIRTATPKGDYKGTVAAIVGLVRELETVTGQTGTVGVGIPGTSDSGDGAGEECQLDLAEWQAVADGFG